MSRHLRAWLRPGPANSMWGRGLSEQSEFRSPHNRDWGKGTRRATPGCEWFWVLLPKQKDLVVRGRNPARTFPLLSSPILDYKRQGQALIEDPVSLSFVFLPLPLGEGRGEGDQFT